MPDSLLTVGWREYVSLPDMGLPAIKAKVDTGARTSALHAFRIEEYERDGIERVRFWIHPLRKYRQVIHEADASVADRRVVSDSGGHKELRCVIRTQVVIAGASWPIEITLTNRDGMIFPMLLGRTAMHGRLAVDPSRSYVLGRSEGRAFQRSLIQALRS